VERLGGGKDRGPDNMEGAGGEIGEESSQVEEDDSPAQPGKFFNKIAAGQMGYQIGHSFLTPKLVLSLF